MESLQGNFLIATPQMPDPRFREMVIYICASTPEGSMGLAVNQPLPDITVADILRNTEISVTDVPLPPVYIGGPMEMETSFFLYSADYQARSCIAVSDSVHLSRDPEILLDIALDKGPKEYIFVLGYAGWAPGQLENELKMNGWLLVPAADEIIFRTEDSLKWQKAARAYGIDITIFSDVAGTA